MSLEKKFVTGGGVSVTRNSQELPYISATDNLVTALNTQRGVFLSSSFEYPKRYSRWDLGFTNPPIEIVARGRCMEITALNARGKVLLPAIYQALEACPEQNSLKYLDQVITLNVTISQEEFTEEQRSQQPSVFSILRSIIRLFAHKDDSYLGLYGAFGYELCFQFEAIKTSLKRDADARDMVLYIPDEIIAVDHSSKLAFCYQYEFEFNNQETKNKARDGESNVFTLVSNSDENGAAAFTSDHAPGEYANCVRKAIEYFTRGDLYEVVPGQVFAQPCIDLPSEIFRRLKAANPAPYGALINLGEQEYLVAASPEMFVRVDGRRVETCPISGTIKRGRDPMEDTRQIIALLNSEKEESELTMCTDVDRNDKSRICEPGTIRLLGRRQIEMYSRLIHTVDHVEGILREEFDAIDGFLAHAWAVTVTGAPKQSAIQFIEDNEKSPRRWYGGAMGSFLFNGNVNTGLTLRTMRIKDGVAEVRAGATLLYDSDPDAEEAETHLKASALLGIINPSGKKPTVDSGISFDQYDNNRKLVILMVDHQDSFVHTLGGYLRRTGASVITMRPKMAREHLAKESPDLLVLSPGPGRPNEYEMHETIQMAQEKKIPVFGVCLGLQGIVEYFGGTLRQLEHPMHGKPSRIRLVNEGIFKDLPESTFTAGRYHSLCANEVPATLKVLATTEDDTIMAIQHVDLPVAAVQFHPESILSQENNVGHRLLVNMLSDLIGTT